MQPFYMRYHFFFCTMDGFFRFLEQTSSELICTRLYYETKNKVWHQEKNEWVPNIKMTPKCENLYSLETAGIYFEDTCFETMDYFHIFFQKLIKLEDW